MNASDIDGLDVGLFLVGARQKIARDSSANVGGPDELRLASDEEGSLKDGFNPTKFLTKTFFFNLVHHRKFRVFKRIANRKHSNLPFSLPVCPRSDEAPEARHCS